MLTSWKKFRYRLEEIGCRALASAIPKLSRGRCVRLGNALGSIAYGIDGRGRAVALSNLQCAFGERFTPAQRRQIARASYQNFLRTMLDLFWSRQLTAENWQHWIEPIGFEPIRAQLTREKRGTIFIGVHQGHWEWANLACGFLGFRNTVVTENFKNPLLTAIFAEARQVSGQTMIPQESSILRLLKVAKRGGVTGMLIDLSLPPSQAATVTEGFGMKMCVPLLHAVLAARVGALLVPLETQPQSDGHCRIIAHPPIEFPPESTLQEIAQLCWNAFEPIIAARPATYLWPYKHFRYRPKGAEHEYPEYSHESAKFEKLLKSLAAQGRPK